MTFSDYYTIYEDVCTMKDTNEITNEQAIELLEATNETFIEENRLTLLEESDFDIDETSEVYTEGIKNLGKALTDLDKADSMIFFNRSGGAALKATAMATVKKELIALSLKIGATIAIGYALNKVTRVWLQQRLNNYMKLHSNVVPFNKFKKEHASDKDLKKYSETLYDKMIDSKTRIKGFTYKYKNKLMCIYVESQISTVSSGYDNTVSTYGPRQCEFIMIDPMCKANEEYYSASMAVKNNIGHGCLKNYLKKVTREWKIIGDLLKKKDKIVDKINDKIYGKYEESSIYYEDLYECVLSELEGKYFNDEICFEDAEAIAEKAYDKYIIEASFKITKKKEPEIYTIPTGLNFKSVKVEVDKKYKTDDGFSFNMDDLKNDLKILTLNFDKEYADIIKNDLSDLAKKWDMDVTPEQLKRMMKISSCEYVPGSSKYKGYFSIFVNGDKKTFNKDFFGGHCLQIFTDIEDNKIKLSFNIAG